MSNWATKRTVTIGHTNYTVYCLLVPDHYKRNSPLRIQDSLKCSADLAQLDQVIYIWIIIQMKF
jgi:hypothetical protein